MLIPTTTLWFRAVLPAAVWLFMAPLSPLSGADSPLRDPRIPDGERAVYRSREDDREWTFVETTDWVASESGRAYRFRSKSEREISEVLVTRGSMVPVHVESESRGADLRIKNTTTLSISNPPPGHDRIMLLSFSDLKYLLRGYRFDRAETVDIGFYSTAEEDDDEEANYEVAVIYRGTEVIETDRRSVECHKLQLKTAAKGILRIVNGLIPKTFYWYSVEHPHYLVAYEGSGGFPGSPVRRIEIVDYSAW